MAREVFSNPQESQAALCLTLTWEDKRGCDVPSSSSFPQLYILSMKSHGMEPSSGPLGSAVLSVPPPPSFLCTPSLLDGRVG